MSNRPNQMLRATVVRRPIPWLALCGALIALSSARAVAQTCPGDCDGDMKVLVNELIKGVNIDLGLAEVSTCPAMDRNHNLKVTIDELVTAVANALNGCPTSTPTPTATSAPTAMRTVTPSPTMGTGNLPPAAVDDAAATLVGEVIHIVVLANDTDPNGDSLDVTTFTQPATGTVSFTNDVATYTPNGGFSGTDSFTYTIGDRHGGTASATVTVVVNTLPPDPVTAAPPPANGVATIVADATSFLYTGANAVQFGVAPDTIEPIRAAVVRGKVMTRAGDPLPGVRITILNHPELGFTASRADGMFDLAVNGGGVLTINYEKTGFCPVQRTLNAPWQDYVMAPDVVMIGLDPIVTAVTLGTSGMQVAQGSMQSDASGTRHAMLLFPPGTTASLVMPDGSTEPVSTLSVRATEFTVGANGPQAMPAVLPPTSAYTYCVELSADEAINAGAMMVVFNQPVINYVENFLNFPIGTAVPIGFYDRQKAAWVPSPNGRVIKILSITGGLADVDTDGDNVADDGLGITSEERQHLATLYASGQSLWRTPVPHFTVVDDNWGFLPVDARSPGQSGAGPSNDAPLECSEEVPAQSVIECDNQVLGESLPIVGTPFSLNYRSDREPGRIATRSFTLSGASVPASLKGIELHISVGGRVFDQQFPPNPNQQFTFVWDRKDAYGRTLLGGQPLTGTIDYRYPINYARSNTEFAFGSAGGAVLLENIGRQEFTVSQPFATVIGEGLTDARVVGLGGWTLSVHHFFDPVARVVHLGNGRRRRADSLTRIINTVVPPPSTGFLRGLAVGPDGSIYFIRNQNSVPTVRRLRPDGTETVVAGGGSAGAPDFGDGGPARQAKLLDASAIAVGPDESIYIVDRVEVIRRVGPDGIIRRVAGTYFSGTACNGGTSLCIQPQGGIAVGPDGSIYTAELYTITSPMAGRIRRIGPDGIITPVAGAPQGCKPLLDPTCGDGRPAIEAGLTIPEGLALAADGTLYVSDGFSIRRVRVDGIIERFAGGSGGFSGDGGPATNAGLCGAFGLAIGADGSVIVADGGSRRIRQIGPDGIINTIAGSGPATFCNMLFLDSGDGGPALAAQVLSPNKLAIAPDGTLLVASNSSRIRRIGQTLPGISAADFFLASEDGSQLYVFDGSGRHLRTLDALTGATLLEFGYDGSGILSQVTEKTGGSDNVTTIQHDGAGNPTAIIGAFGQRTMLGVDANGYLASMSNPASEQTQFSSTPDGLLSSQTDPRGKTSTYMYDSDGRLILDAAPGNVTQTVARVALTNGFQVARTTALGRTTTYAVENLTGNVQRRTTTEPDGTQRQSTETIDAGTTHATSSDGTVSDTTLGPDPRFAMESPVTAKFSLQFPSALQVTATTARSAMLANTADPLSLVSLTQTTTVGGRAISNTYTAATRTVVTNTPAGRVHTVTLDALGRFVQGQIGNLDPVHVDFDTRARLQSISHGSGPSARSVSLAYNAQGFLDTITDSIGRTAHLGYDEAGRVTNKTLADGRVVSLGYDAAGNLTSVTPPGRPAYSLGYSDRNELTRFSPPTVPGSGPTTIAYDADGAVTTISRAGVQRIAIDYDAQGRPGTRHLTSGRGPTTTDTFSYDAAGRTMSVTAASGVTISYDYDGLLPSGMTWSGPVVGNVARTYDDGLRLASQSVNGANPIAFSYDGDGLLIGAGDLAIVRDPQHGLGTGTTLGAVTSSRTFNGSGEMTDYTVSANGSTLYGSRYSRDGIGRIAEKEETIGGVSDTYTYTYDTAGQLTEVVKNGAPIESYAYDANGNRTTATVGGETVDATHDDQDRLTEYGNGIFIYNAAGDLVSKTAGEHTTTFDYDPLGNLRGVTLPDSSAITYLVDGLDRRVGRKVNGTLVQGWLYDDLLRPVAELDGAGAVTNRFVYAGGSTPAYLINGGVSFRVVTDQIGSVRLVVNAATGVIVQRLDYDSFGNVLLDTNPGFQPFGFAGGLYDPATKLVRFGTRDYDPQIGRWTAQDAIGFAGNDPNLYRYCLNDPVNLLDPAGLDYWDAAAGFVEQMNEEIQTTVNPFLGLTLLLDSAVRAGIRQLGFDPGPTLREQIFHSLPTIADRKSEDYATGELAGVCVGVVGQLATGFIGDAAVAARAAEAAETLARQGRIAERLAAQEGRQVGFAALEEAAAEARNAGQRFAHQVEEVEEEVIEFMGWEGGGGGGVRGGGY